MSQGERKREQGKEREQGGGGGEPRGPRECKALAVFFFLSSSQSSSSSSRAKDRFEGIASSTLWETQRSRRRLERVARIAFCPPAKRTRRNEGERERERREREGRGGKPRRRLSLRWQRGRRKEKTLGEFILSLPPSLPFFFLAPPCRARGSPGQRVELPYRKSSGICCTFACSQRTNRRPFRRASFRFAERERERFSKKKKKKENLKDSSVGFSFFFLFSKPRPRPRSERVRGPRGDWQAEPPVVRPLLFSFSLSLSLSPSSPTLRPTP